MKKQKKYIKIGIREVIVFLSVSVVIGLLIFIAKMPHNKKPEPVPQTVQNTPEGGRSQKQDYSAPATISPMELPDDLEATIGFSPNQVNMLSDHYVLAKYDIGQDSIVYYFQTAEATTGERLLVICTKMSQDDYLASVPDKNVTKETYNGIELTYAERWLYSVPNDFEMIEPIQNGIEEGTMEIEYGNTVEEVIRKNCFYWYDNGVKYEIQMRNQNLPYDDLYSFAKKIIDAKNEA